MKPRRKEYKYGTYVITVVTKECGAEITWRVQRVRVHHDQSVFATRCRNCRNGGTRRTLHFAANM